jgi:predicted phage terminase large subunit-like protein
MTQSVAERLAALPREERNALVDKLTPAEQAALLYDWRDFLARPEQIAPEGDWDIWLILSGRGWGKTRTGAEWIKEQVAAGYRRIALIGETAADARDVIVEGVSGILSVYPEAERPLYEPSKRRLTWPNGAIATTFNATEPDQLRGPQFDLAYCDELAKWRYGRETWDQLQFALRLGDHPRVLITTTPRPVELIKAILAGTEGKVHITRGSTMDNRSNLASKFLEKIQLRYEGTRLGRQELRGEILGDIPNALWTYGQIEASRVRSHDQLSRVVVAVDPAISNTEESDEHGIIVAGADQKSQEAYVLEDASMSGSPLEWARRAINLYDTHRADAIVIEVNQGGDMVAQTLRSVRNNVRIKEVRATRGKHVRAEPIASMYEQGRVHHVGSFPLLETQMTQMTTFGYEGAGSPDRVDALVWAMTDLFPTMIGKTPSQRAPVKLVPIVTPMAR